MDINIDMGINMDLDIDVHINIDCIGDVYDHLFHRHKIISGEFVTKKIIMYLRLVLFKKYLQLLIYHSIIKYFLYFQISTF